MGDDPNEQSGVWWQEAGPTPDDYVYATRITACSDAGGPSNLYMVECGSIYFAPDTMEAALSCVGVEPGVFAFNGEVRRKFETEFAARLFIAGQPDQWAFTTMPRVDRHLLVHAYVAYAGLDIDQSYVVQVGKKEDCDGDGWNPTPTDFIRGGSSVKNYVRKEYC